MPGYGIRDKGFGVRDWGIADGRFKIQEQNRPESEVRRVGTRDRGYGAGELENADSKFKNRTTPESEVGKAG
jgi:hypothetical protein